MRIEEIERFRAAADVKDRQADKLTEEITDTGVLAEIKKAKFFLGEIDGLIPRRLAENPAMRDAVVAMAAIDLSIAQRILDPLQDIVDKGGKPISFGGG